MLSVIMSRGPNFITRHFRQDASLVGTMLAFGLSTLVVVVAVTIPMDLSTDSLFALAVVMGPTLALPGLIVFAVRLVRRGSHRGRCDECRAAGAVEVRYLQVTGLLVLAVLKEARFEACSECSARAFSATSAHTALFGWWSVLTPLVVPWVLLNNLAFFLKQRIFRGRGRTAALEEHRDYAKNLLRTKEFEVVVEVISDTTGCDAQVVAEWLRTL
jgi:hypothetical protein